MQKMCTDLLQVKWFKVQMSHFLNIVHDVLEVLVSYEMLFELRHHLLQDAVMMLLEAHEFREPWYKET